MRLKQYIKYVAAPAKVFVTILIILTALIILQAIVIETVQLFAYRMHTPAQVQAEEPNDVEKKLRRISNSSKVCLADGTIHLVTDSDHNRHSPNGQDRYRYVRDTNDKLLWEGPAKECPYDYISWALQSLGGRYGHYNMRRLKSVSPDWVRTVEIPVKTDKVTQQIWRFLPGAECFVGYAFRGRRIGYIGANGFTESKSQAEPFGEPKALYAWCPEDSHSPTALWLTDRSVYQINFEKKEVIQLFTHSQADIERLFMQNWEANSAHKYKPLLYCRTWDGKQHVILSDPVRQITIKPKEDWGPWHNNYFRFAAAEQGLFMQRTQLDTGPMPTRFESRQAYDQWWREYRARPKTQRFALYTIDDQGSLNLVNQFEWTNPGQKPQLAKANSFYRRTRHAISQFSPPLYDILCYALVGRVWGVNYPREPNEIVREVLQALSELRPEFGLWNLMLTALMTAFAAWHALPRRTSQLAFIFWLVFVGLFNLAGLLTYLALNHTPVIKCPSCGRTRGLNQPKCTRCQADLPAPKPGRLDLIFDTTLKPTT